jgi:hypothetical protein
VRGCFGPLRQQRTIAFGTGLLYTKGDPLSRRIYMSADEPLAPAERRCVATKLVGVSAGGAPGAMVVVELRLRLRPDGTNEVRTMLAK